MRPGLAFLPQLEGVRMNYPKPIVDIEQILREYHRAKGA